MQNSESETRAPISYEWNPYNWFLQKFGTNLEDPGAFEKFLQSLQENPPDVMAGSGFHGVVPFDWGLRGGGIAGRHDPLLGGWTIEHPEPCIGHQRLPPDELKNRIAKLEEYTQDLHNGGGVKRVMPYIDFGTQLMGRHNRPQTIPDPCAVADFANCPHLAPAMDCPADVPPSVWGFWEFYDHWEEYAKPTGKFSLGPKPPDPTTWLRKWYAPDPNIKLKQWPHLPDELKGLSFSYGPRHCCNYGPHYRYAVCINTKGWELWWKQVVQWAAHVGYDGVFVDNAYFQSCWNDECQEDYRKWLKKNFTKSEVRRYFTTTIPNLLTDPSIEVGWHQEMPGQWRTSYWGSYPKPSPIFPDTDAFGGRYSCRIEGPGGSQVPSYFSHSTQLVPADKDLRLTFYYKTQGNVQTTMVIEWVDLAEPPPLEKVLAPAGKWKQETVDFHTPAGTAKFYLRFEVRGTGKVWLDEFWLGEVSQPPEFRVELEKPFGEPVRSWAAATYWSHVTDERLGYLRKEARKVNPKFELFTNGFHAVNADYFMSEGVLVPDLDSYRKKERKDVGFYPGIYTSTSLVGSPESVLTTNSFGYKYVHSLRLPNHFGYHMPQLLPPPGTPDGYHNPDSVLLNLAEAAAFGGGAGCDASNLRLNSWAYDEEQEAAIREAEKQFWTFIQGHKHLYEGYRTHADVGIVCHNLLHHPGPSAGPPGREEYVQITDLAKDLAGRGVLSDVLTENRCNNKNFARLGALIYQDISWISEAEAQAVQEYLEQGGLVIAAGTVGDKDEWFRMRLSDPNSPWPPVGLPPTLPSGVRPRPAPLQQQVGAGTLIYEPGPLTADPVIAAIEAHLGRTIQLVNPPLRLNAWVRKKGGARIVLHIVNYSVALGKDNGGQVQPLSDVEITVPLPPEMQAHSVVLHTPETSGPTEGPVPFSQTADGLLTFTIPHLRVYSVALVKCSQPAGCFAFLGTFLPSARAERYDG